nr:uncharacterized protein LOC109172167 [Ipomoea batatas]
MEVVRNSWQSNNYLTDNLQVVSDALSIWNKLVFCHILKRKKTTLARLEGIQRRLPQHKHRGLVKLENKLIAEYQEILYQKELMWFQRSREDWIVSGDRNTKYYHTAVMIRLMGEGIRSRVNGSDVVIVHGDIRTLFDFLVRDRAHFIQKVVDKKENTITHNVGFGFLVTELLRSKAVKKSKAKRKLVIEEEGQSKKKAPKIPKASKLKGKGVEQPKKLVTKKSKKETTEKPKEKEAEMSPNKGETDRVMETRTC